MPQLRLAVRELLAGVVSEQRVGPSNAVAHHRLHDPRPAVRAELFVVHVRLWRSHLGRLFRFGPVRKPEQRVERGPRSPAFLTQLIDCGGEGASRRAHAWWKLRERGGGGERRSRTESIARQLRRGEDREVPRDAVVAAVRHDRRAGGPRGGVVEVDAAPEKVRLARGVRVVRALLRAHPHQMFAVLLEGPGRGDDNGGVAHHAAESGMFRVRVRGLEVGDQDRGQDVIGDAEATGDRREHGSGLRLRARAYRPPDGVSLGEEVLARELSREAGDSEEDDVVLAVGHGRRRANDVCDCDVRDISRQSVLLRPRIERAIALWRRRSERRRRRASHTRDAGGCHRDVLARSEPPRRVPSAGRDPSPTRGQMRFARD